MDAIRYQMKMESRLYPATLFSLLLHCIIAALLVYCIRERRLLPVPQMIISVDISTLEPEREEKPPVVPAAPKKPGIKSPPEPRLPVKSALQQPQKTVTVPLPVPTPVPSQATTVETPQTIHTAQGGMVFPARPPAPPISAARPSRPDTATTSGTATLQPVNAAIDVKQEPAYLAALKEIIERNKEYPLMARRGGMEGTVRIRCALGRNGDLMDSAVIKPSGYTILDKAALRAVRSAGRFPRVPAEIKGDTFSFVAPITFRLDAQ